MEDNNKWTSIKKSPDNQTSSGQKRSIDWSKERTSMPCSRTVSVRVSYRYSIGAHKK